MKRLLDLVMSLVAVVLALPLLVAVALGVRLQDGGPSLFGQRRVGLGGREFRMWKFRSMVVDADRLGGYSTAERDPRITPLGRWIRRTSVDELPQVFNVLTGDMSIVGPRPDVPAQRSLYTDEEWQLRHSVRPGITGLAQATLRSEATPEQRKALDLEYARSASLALDLRIILLTVRQVLFKGGN
ncbi:sugar transferase [Piscinibacter aquaticus]|uniref:Sugar transferase n=1 Tax=Piscinibacter aquaticus TaxID=392597 RepID=A0A5C6TY11_9BURK|nr:sugar transferase [Piscinibacter aquaticus]